MYGLLISLSILISAFAAEKIAEEKQMDVKFLWDALFGCLVTGIIFARIYYVLSMWEYYSTAPFEIFKIWRGGSGIWGALFGGILYLVLYAHYKKEPILKWMDIAAIFMPLSQAIGRIGNFINQELYGKPTNLPWGIYIRPENRVESVILYERFHPLFFYESVLNILLFIILIKVSKKLDRVGLLFSLYLVGYGIIRFFLEPLRIQTWEISGLNIPQTISILVILIGFVFIKRAYKKA